jgi:hypothetical protein
MELYCAANRALNAPNRHPTAVRVFQAKGVLKPAARLPVVSEDYRFATLIAKVAYSAR